MNHNAKKTIREYLIHFAAKAECMVQDSPEGLYIDHREISHGYDKGYFYATQDAAPTVDGEDAEHVAAVFIAHIKYKKRDGFDIQLEPDWYREEKAREK